MSADLYLHEAIKEVETKWGDWQACLRYRLDIPVAHIYHPELDTMDSLGDDNTQLHQSYIEFLDGQWSLGG